MSRLRVSTLYTIWCEVDKGEWESSDVGQTRVEFVSAMRKKGWKVLDGQTHCPACVELRKEGKLTY